MTNFCSYAAGREESIYFVLILAEKLKENGEISYNYIGLVYSYALNICCCMCTAAVIQFFLCVDLFHNHAALFVFFFLFLWQHIGLWDLEGNSVGSSHIGFLSQNKGVTKF